MKLFKPLLFVALTALTLCNNASAQLGRQQGLLDPNLAGEKELLALPHLNAALVKGILGSRPFLSMADLNTFLGKSLKPEQLTELYAKLFIHLNLNTASEAEIMMIPGVGKRIAHEFEEYRPYKNIEQFRREMAKYWNAKEVARLERYVTLE